VNQTASPPNQEITFGNYDDGDISRVEPRGFEPLTSAVQRRPDESATVRSLPESAANAHILVMGTGRLIRIVSLNVAWVGVRLVSSLGHVWEWDIESLHADLAIEALQISVPAADKSWPRTSTCGKLLNFWTGVVAMLVRGGA
jgi:hypothetical protein